MFSPLGTWSPRSPIPDALIDKGHAFAASLPDLTVGSSFIRDIFWHWSVELLCDSDAHYSGSATYANGVWSMSLGTSCLGNAAGDPDTEAAHTWRRNSHAFGLALAGMDGATETNFGPDPVTHAGLDTMLMMGAAVAMKYDIDVTASVGRHDAYGNYVTEPAGMTHAEVALVDRYYPGDGDPDSRWDFSSLIPLPVGVELDRSWPKIVGDAFRDRTHTYKLALMHG